MVEPRTLVVQSVLYQNSAHDIVRAGRAIANSVRFAREAGLIGTWSVQIGDCSPEPVLGPDSLEVLREAIEAQSGTFEYSVFGKNLGSAAGQNALAAHTEAELLLILNPDAQVDPDTVSTLATVLVGDVGIVEARQVPLEHPKDYHPDSGDTSWASTACALTTREAFNKVQGFDSATFFLYCDDVDYSWRLRLVGYRVVYEPAARVFHDKRLTITADWPASSAEIYYSAEAAILLAHKYSRPDLVRTLVTQYQKEGGQAVLKAVDEYKSRKELGQLPAPLDVNHRVAQFVNGNYARHRF